MYADVILPLQIGPLTYKIDSPVNNEDIIGAIVLVPFRNKLRYGLVVSVSGDNQSGKETRELKSIGPIFCDKGFISFIHWVAEYYVSYPGIALKCCPFDEAVALIKRSGKPRIGPEVQHDPPPEHTNINGDEIDLEGISAQQFKEILARLSEDRYMTLLVQVYSEGLEASFVAYALRHLANQKRGIIILVPEIRYIKGLQQGLLPLFGHRLGVFHSQLNVAQRVKFIEDVLSGSIDVVIGTRSAIFTPLRSLSLIIVLSEHSRSYKAEELLKYNARDLAVMRGYRSNCPVLLTSISPSLESVFNGRNNKYIYYTIESHKRCRIRPVLHTFNAQLRSALSAEVLRVARGIIQKGGTFLFVSQREGYSILYCTDCGTVARCQDCGSSLLFFDDSKTLGCNHCGRGYRVELSCRNCKGFNLTPLGGGIERLKAEVERSLGLKTTVIDNPTDQSGSIWLSSVVKKGTVFRLQEGIFDGAAVVDFDYLLQKADFRATERVFQDIVKVSSLLKERGLLLIQTKDTRSNLIMAIKSYNFKAFYDHELALRSSAGYPPYRRLATFEVYTKGAFPEEMLNDLRDRGVEIIGPVEIWKTEKGDKRGQRYILKSLNKRDMDLFFREMETRLRAIKGTKILIDVDPM